jgi:hypothetical protein
VRKFDRGRRIHGVIPSAARNLTFEAKADFDTSRGAGARR